MKNVLTIVILFIGFITQAQVMAYPPDDLTECDDDFDGFAVFDLTQTYDQIIGDQDPLEHLIYFYETQQDADINVNAIVNDIAYTNIFNPQTIYVRLEHAATGNYDTTFFALIVLPKPTPNAPTPLVVCDDDNDGFADFILTDKDAEIINGEPDLTITYHETLGEADLGILSIPSPYTNATPFSQIVYARVENDVSGCFAVVELKLSVNNTPIISPITDYILFDNGDDGVETFDLTTKNPEILNGQTEITVHFFETELDAETFTNPILFPEAYQNISNPQTIYVGLLDDNNICYSAAGAFDLVLDTTIGFEDNETINLSIFPNPASEMIQIQSTSFSSETLVQFYNIQGQVVLSEIKNSENDDFSINISSLPTGMYFVQIQSEGLSQTKKLIKQ